MNKKGFTLIEAIVSFAIIAIAGTMFMFGFRNITTIAMEGSMIKTETDQLYSDIMNMDAPGPKILYEGTKDEQVIDTPYENINIFFKDGSSTLSKIYISKKEKKVNEEFNISLSRLIPLKTVDFLPDNIPDEPVKEDTTIKTTFRILQFNGYIPSYDSIARRWNSNDINKYYYTKSSDYDKCLTEKASKLTTGSKIYDDISSYIYDIPIDVENDIDSIQYKTYRITSLFQSDLLANGYKIQWLLLEKDTDTHVTVYGFLLPTGNSRYAIYKGRMDYVSGIGLGAWSIIYDYGVRLPNGDVNIVNINTDVIQQGINGYNLKWNFNYRNQYFKASSGIWYIYD